MWYIQYISSWIFGKLSGSTPEETVLPFPKEKRYLFGFLLPEPWRRLKKDPTDQHVPHGFCCLQLFFILVSEQSEWDEFSIKYQVGHHKEDLIWLFWDIYLIHSFQGLQCEKWNYTSTPNMHKMWLEFFNQVSYICYWHAYKHVSTKYDFMHIIFLKILIRFNHIKKN